MRNLFGERDAKFGGGKILNKGVVWLKVSELDFLY
jgi:hypothetical protein